MDLVGSSFQLHFLLECVTIAIVNVLKWNADNEGINRLMTPVALNEEPEEPDPGCLICALHCPQIKMGDVSLCQGLIDD